MNPVSHTVFSDSNPKVSEQSESKKISYWLKKLFDQQEQKKINDKSPPDMPELKKSPEQIGVSCLLHFRLYPARLCKMILRLVT